MAPFICALKTVTFVLRLFQTGPPSRPVRSPENPVDRDVIDRKFMTLTKGILDAGQGAAIRQLVSEMERLPGIGALAKLLAVTQPPDR